jgi:hypothetical protein
MEKNHPLLRLHRRPPMRAVKGEDLSGMARSQVTLNGAGAERPLQRLRAGGAVLELQGALLTQGAAPPATVSGDKC